MSAAAPILLTGSVGSFWDENIVATGREAEFLFFAAFLITFGFIRTSAHLIRAQVSWWPGNVSVGGTHIHHLVWGICLLLIFGWLGVTQDLGSPWLQIDAIVFGFGTGLTLDEFALWLNLRDVYWEKEGRASIDAVIIVASVTGLLLVGLRGWVEAGTDLEHFILNVVGVGWIVTVAAAAVCVSKAKYAVALIGLLISPVAIIGALRLGRPTSFWARHRYDEEKMARARKRFTGRRGPLEAIDSRLHRAGGAVAEPHAATPGPAPG